jgi:hypothetical protein
MNHPSLSLSSLSLACLSGVGVEREWFIRPRVVEAFARAAGELPDPVQRRQVLSWSVELGYTQVKRLFSFELYRIIPATYGTSRYIDIYVRCGGLRTVRRRTA